MASTWWMPTSGPSGVLTGSARARAGSAGKSRRADRQQEAPAANAEIERSAPRSTGRSAGLGSDYEAEAVELRRIDEQVGTSTLMLTSERAPPASCGRRTPRWRSLPAQAAAREGTAMKPKEASPPAVPGPRRPAKLWQLRLYVMTRPAKSLTAFANLKEICEATSRVAIAITRHRSGQAPRNWQGATRSWPFPRSCAGADPVRTIIGNLSTQRVLVGLDLRLPCNRDPRPENSRLSRPCNARFRTRPC